MEAIQLNKAADGATVDSKPIYLLNGDLTLNNSETNVDLTTGGANVGIPSTTILKVSIGILNFSDRSLIL